MSECLLQRNDLCVVGDPRQVLPEVRGALVELEAVPGTHLMEDQDSRSLQLREDGISCREDQLGEPEDHQVLCSEPILSFQPRSRPSSSNSWRLGSAN